MFKKKRVIAQKIRLLRILSQKSCRFSMTNHSLSQKTDLSELLPPTIFLALTLPWIWTRGLQNPDELRYASVVVEMIARSDYITPYINGVPYFEKPPLTYWLGVLSVKLFGSHIGVYRLCSLLSGLGIVVLAGKFGRYYGCARISLNAGLIAGTMAFVFVFSQGFTPDILVAFWITLSIWFLCQLLYEKSGNRNPRTDLIMFYLSCSFAVMSKGFIGIVLPALILIAISVHLRSFASILKLCRWEGPLILIAICLPWHLILEARHPGFLNFYVIQEHLFRYSTTFHHRDKAFWYLPVILMLGTFPWSLFTLPALFSSINLKYSPSKRTDLPRFMLLWTLVPLGFFWLSKSLLPGYLLPVIVPISVLIGSHIAEKGDSYINRACAVASALCLTTALLLYFPLVLPHIKTTFLSNISTFETSSIIITCALLIVAFTYQACSALSVSLTAIAAIPFFLVTGHIVAKHEPKSIRMFFLENHAWANGRDVAVYKTYLLDPVFYLERPVIFIDRISELDYGNRIAPRDDLFWNTEKFTSEIARGHRFTVIGRETELERFANANCFAKKDGFTICHIN